MKNHVWIIVFSVSLLFSACQQSEKVKTVKKTVKHQQKPLIVPRDSSICIAAVGDMMLGSSYPSPLSLPPDSARNSFRAASKYLREADIAFGNLEGTLLDSGVPEGKKKFKPYLFRMPVNYGQVFKDAGFDLLSIANNHIDDFGAKGRKSTGMVLDSCGIQYAGLQVKPSTIFTVNGVKFGFCAFAPNSYVVSLHDYKNAGRIIGDLKQQVDIVIVSFHGGGEGVGFEHVMCQKETFIGENRGDVHQFAHHAIDAGADVVFGNGPHVSRAMELYNNHLIAYSLGNFCTYKSVSVAGVCGMAPLLQVHLDKKGKFLNGKIIAFKQDHWKGLERDTLNRVISRIKYLTETDFPQSGLMISNNGLIEPVR